MLFVTSYLFAVLVIGCALVMSIDCYLLLVVYVYC